MKYSIKGPPPECFIDWLDQATPDWQPTYSNFSGAEKAGTHRALLQEQGYVCAYCGRGLQGDRSDSHIDHFWPQKYFTELNLDYDNFFASCGPGSLPSAPKSLPRTCGDAKGDWFDNEFFILPSDSGCEQRFTYGSSGHISLAVPNDRAADNMIRHLNLLDAALVYERQMILADLETAISRREITRANVADEMSSWRARNADGRLPNFGQVAARYLEDESVFFAEG